MRFILDALSSYLIALGSMVLGNMDGVVKYGGALLLIVRLIADAPRATRNIKKWAGYGDE